MNAEQICDDLVAYLRADLMLDASETVDTEANVFASGLIDSMGVMRMITFIEEHFGLKIPPVDLVPANFRTLQVTSEYIAEQMKNR